VDDYKEQLLMTTVGVLEFSELPEIQLSRCRAKAVSMFWWVAL